MKKTLMLVVSLALIAAVVACAPKIRAKNGGTEAFDMSDMDGVTLTINGSENLVPLLNGLAAGATTKYIKCEKGDAVQTYAFEGASMSMNLTNADGSQIVFKNFKKYTFTFDADGNYSVDSPISGFVAEDAEAGL